MFENDNYPKRRSIAAHTGSVLWPLYLTLLTAPAHGADDVVGVGTFVTNEEFVRTRFEGNDEAFVRAFAKKMGVEFDSQMELPLCQMRTELSTAGAYLDGYVGDPSIAYARIPIPDTDVTFEGAQPLRNGRFTNKVYIEARRIRPVLAEQHSWPKWDVRLVLPPVEGMEDPGHEPFRVAAVTYGNHAFSTAKIEYLPGLPTAITLPNFISVIQREGAGAEMRAIVQVVAPAGLAAPKVTMVTSLRTLLSDFEESDKELKALLVRHEKASCAVVGRDCMDGECK